MFMLWYDLLKLYDEFLVDTCDLFTYIPQGCFIGAGAIISLLWDQ